MNVHLITSLNQGGTEKFLLEYLKSVSQKMIIVVLKGRGHYSDEFERIAEEVIYLELQKIKIINIVRLIFILRKTKDLRLICWLSHAQILGTILSKFIKFTEIVFMYRQSIQNFASLSYREKIVLYFACKVSPQADLSIFNSYASKETFIKRGADPKKSLVLHNGVNLKKFSFDKFSRERRRSELGLTDSDFLVLHVGRWHSEKGTDFAFMVAEELLFDAVDIKFHLIGCPDKRFDKFRQSLLATDRVTWSESSSDIVADMSAADVLLVTSRSESCPNVVLEALANRLPVVGTNVGDIWFYVDPSFLCEFGDLDSMVSAIKEVKFSNGNRKVQLNVGTSKVIDQLECFKQLNLILGD